MTISAQQSNVKNIFFQMMIFSLLSILFFPASRLNASPQSKERVKENFDNNWRFHLGDVNNGQDIKLKDAQWRELNLPHDWSIEGKFNKNNPASVSGGALPGGIGWYRKTFTLPESDKDKLVFINFDGVYRDGQVWINGHYLGIRPYGYSSFQYELTPYLNYGSKKNIIAVKVDNSKQPNSRWYSGSGIYRNVWLVTTNKVYVDHWGTYITTPEVTNESAKVSIQVKVRNATGMDQNATVKTTVLNKDGEKVAEVETRTSILKDSAAEVSQNLTVKNPELWSVENPYLYNAVTTIENGSKTSDD